MKINLHSTPIVVSFLMIFQFAPFVAFSQLEGNYASVAASGTSPDISNTSNPYQTANASTMGICAGGTARSVINSAAVVSQGSNCNAGQTATSVASFTYNYNVDGANGLNLSILNNFTFSGSIEASTSGPMPQCSATTGSSNINYIITNNTTQTTGQMGIVVQGGIPVINYSSGGFFSGEGVKAKLKPRILASTDLPIDNAALELLLQNALELAEANNDSASTSIYNKILDYTEGDVNVELFESEQSEVPAWAGALVVAIQTFGLNSLGVAPGSVVDIGFDTQFFLDSNFSFEVETIAGQQNYLNAGVGGNVAGVLSGPCVNTEIANLGSTLIYNFSYLKYEDYDESLNLDSLFIRVTNYDSIFPISFLDIPLMDEPELISDTEVNLTWRDRSSRIDGIVIEKSLGDTLNFTPIDTLAPGISSYTNVVELDTSVYYRTYIFKERVRSDYSNVVLVEEALTNYNILSTELLSVAPYPNPFCDQINITTPTEQPLNMTLFDSSGKVVNKVRTQGNSTIRLENTPSGVYFLSVTDGDVQEMIKLVKLCE